MAQASLPKNLLKKKLSDLKVGESAYTTPWAMEVDRNGKVWMNINMIAMRGIEASSTMKVTKTAAGWVCDISKCGDYQWDEYGMVDKYPPVIQLITR